MNLGIAGRLALVGGGSSGLGLAVAHALAAEGCNLLLWSNVAEELKSAAADIRNRHGVEVSLVCADSTEPDAVTQIASAVESSADGADIIFLNSGGPPPVGALATTRDGWAAGLALLTITPILLATRLMPYMRAQRWGRVVVSLSSGVREPIPDLVYSNAGRAALVGWLKTAAAEVASEGVTVNGVMPGRIGTPRIVSLDRARASRVGIAVDAVRAESARSIPLGRYGEPTEYAVVVAFLASRLASYVTGALVPVDGGLLKSI